MALIDEYVEDEIVDARRFLNIVLQQIEIRPSVVIQGDDLTVHNRIFGKFAERFIDPC